MHGPAVIVAVTELGLTAVHRRPDAQREVRGPPFHHHPLMQRERRERRRGSLGEHRQPSVTAP